MTQQQDVSEKENMMQQDAPAEEAAQTADENEKISDTESIRLTGERTPVQRDKTTMHDEVQDFKFLKPKSVRRETSHSHSSSGSGHHHHHHHRRHRKKKMKTWKKVLLIVVSVILALVIAVTGTVIYLVFKGQSELFDVDLRIEVPQSVPAEVQDNGDYIVYDGATYRYNRDVTSLLFMGVDKRNIDGVNEVGTGGQSDVNVLIAINVKSHKLSMVAIPRDTLAEVARYTPSGTYNGMGTMQICLGYAYGNGKETSCDNMVSSVSKLFYNLPIKTYYALDLDGIAAMNDAVGGVDVVSPEDVSDVFVKGESYHLEGKDAEHFVRLRDKSKVSSSLDRLERQKVYAKSYLSTLQSKLKKNPTSAITLFNESSPYSCTNLTAAKVAYLAKEVMFGGGLKPEILTVPGTMTYDGELASYHVNEEKFFKQFLEVFYEKM